MKTYSLKKFWLIMVLSAILLAPTSSVWASDRSDRNERVRRDQGRDRHEEVFVGRNRYYYRDGHFTRPWWFGFQFAIAIPPVGVIVSSLPAGTRTVIVENIPYYYYDHVYYRPCPRGYVVVSAPAVRPGVVYVPVR